MNNQNILKQFPGLNKNKTQIQSLIREEIHRSNQRRDILNTNLIHGELSRHSKMVSTVIINFRATIIVERLKGLCVVFGGGIQTQNFDAYKLMRH